MSLIFRLFAKRQTNVLALIFKGFLIDLDVILLDISFCPSLQFIQTLDLLNFQYPDTPIVFAFLGELKVF